MKGFIVGLTAREKEEFIINVGERYEIDKYEEIETGFRFFTELYNTSQFCEDYMKTPIYEVEAYGFVENTDINNLYVTDKIEVLRIVPFEEIKQYYWLHKDEIANCRRDNWYARRQMVLFGIEPEQFADHWCHHVRSAVANNERY